MAHGSAVWTWPGFMSNGLNIEFGSYNYYYAV